MASELGLIAAVVVTYNRLDELRKNVNMLLAQTKRLDRIYIINNASTDDTHQYLDVLDAQTFIVCHLEKNVGGAGGFAYGMRRAYQDGYNWVWLMDDDGRPEKANTLEVLLKCAEVEWKQHGTFALYNCNVLHNCEELSFQIGTPYGTLTEQRKHAENGIIENCACVFNGSLFGREAISRVGEIRAEYFIRGDEVEYLMRCKNANVYVVTVVESLYYHPMTVYTSLSFCGKCFCYEVMPLWKEYFLVRNYSATRKTIATDNQKKTCTRFLQLTLLGALLYYRNFRRIGMLLKAIHEGKIGLFDNTLRR